MASPRNKSRVGRSSGRAYREPAPMVETEFVPKEVQAIGPDKGHRGWRFFGLWNVRRHGGLHAVAAKAFLAMKGAGAISGSRARVLLVNSHPDTWFSEYIVEVAESFESLLEVAHAGPRSTATRLDSRPTSAASRKNLDVCQMRRADSLVAESKHASAASA